MVMERSREWRRRRWDLVRALGPGSAGRDSREGAQTHVGAEDVLRVAAIAHLRRVGGMQHRAGRRRRKRADRPGELIAEISDSALWLERQSNARPELYLRVL